MILSRGILIVLLVYVFAIFQFQTFSSKHSTNKLSNSQSTNKDAKRISFSNTTTNHVSQPKKQKDYCEFRNYPPRRYYGLSAEQASLPDFLKDSEYIYGQLPTMMQPKKTAATQKLCVDQSEWYPPPQEAPSLNKLPFADGTNPSILKLADNPRIDASVRNLFPANAQYLATICMTNSQCAWNDSPQEQEEYRLSTQTEPSTIRTVLLVLDQHFATLQEATIVTLMDAPYGKRKKAQYNQDNKTFFQGTFALDDARLFTFQGQVWVSYREGKLFGYDKQVLNPMHFEYNDNQQELKVQLRASDTESLCCGRNMALMDNVHTNQLQALTWVDPVTVVDIEMIKPQHLATKVDHRRRLGENMTKKKKKKSHFHGTNGFMVHLPRTQEYLGIGHFHRPPGREANDYARFGHHYTHAFFTISDTPPFHLKRLSPELVLPSHAVKDDAEVIQFWSGLELLDDKTLSLAYGINDCEGAATTLELSSVEAILRVVEPGKEVVDYMMPLAL